MSSMKRPQPVSSAESSTRAIDRPTQGEPDPGGAVAGLVAFAIRKAFLPRKSKCVRKSYSAVFVTRNIRRSRNLPFRLISQERAVQYQLARRETLRNSRGETPAWLRKKRVKCAGSA